MGNELSTMETIPDKFPGEFEDRTGDAVPENSLVTKTLCALAKGQMNEHMSASEGEGVPYSQAVSGLCTRAYLLEAQSTLWMSDVNNVLDQPFISTYRGICRHHQSSHHDP